MRGRPLDSLGDPDRAIKPLACLICKTKLSAETRTGLCQKCRVRKCRRCGNSFMPQQTLANSRHCRACSQNDAVALRGLDGLA